MLKGVQTRRSIHTILHALKNNKDVFEKILNKQNVQDIHHLKEIDFLEKKSHSSWDKSLSYGGISLLWTHSYYSKGFMRLKKVNFKKESKP